MTEQSWWAICLAWDLLLSAFSRDRFGLPLGVKQWQRGSSIRFYAGSYTWSLEWHCCEQMAFSLPEASELMRRTNMWTPECFHVFCCHRYHTQRGTHDRSAEYKLCTLRCISNFPSDTAVEMQKAGVLVPQRRDWEGPGRGLSLGWLPSGFGIPSPGRACLAYDLLLSLQSFFKTTFKAGLLVWMHVLLVLRVFVIFIHIYYILSIVFFFYFTVLFLWSQAALSGGLGKAGYKSNVNK